MKILCMFFFVVTSVSGLALSDRELDSIGRRVWQNECAGTRDGLTSWNAGENFASLGIGHFIWYPQGVHGPFEESFPKLVRFLAGRGAPVPAWLEGACPWTSRAEFQAAFQGEKMRALRALLAGSVAVQAQFLAQRMEAALPKMRAAAPVADRANVQAVSRRGLGTAAGAGRDARQRGGCGAGVWRKCGGGADAARAECAAGAERGAVAGGVEVAGGGVWGMTNDEYLPRSFVIPARARSIS